MSALFALPHPWSLYDTAGQPGVSRQKLGQAPVTIQAGGALFLAVPEGRRLTARGRKRGMEREGRAFPLANGSYELRIVSVGTRSDERRFEIAGPEGLEGAVDLIGHLPRPGWTAGVEGGAPTERRAEALDRFILDTIERIRSADDPTLVDLPTHWARLEHAWSQPGLESPDPPLELIVRQAESMRALIAELASHPRRILRRTREQMPLGRVQQLDTTCIRWLSRQPGRDVYERAGPRQRILAVARYETLDTLENRVLRAFAELSRNVARDYCRRYDALRHSVRWRLVDRYAAECRRISRELREVGIGLPEPPVVPNFVLLQEPRYRRVWIAWRELLRRLDEQDEAWRWQHRLWADFCRLVVHVCLRHAADVETIAEAPLRIAHEQMRGRWSLVDGQTGVFLATKDGRRFVVSSIGDMTADHPKVEPWMCSLGAVCMLHVQALDNGAEAVVFVWPVHGAGSARPALEQQVLSAGRALSRCLDQVELSSDRPRAGGLVLLSEVELDDHQQPCRDERNHVVGLSYGPGPHTLARAVGRLADGLLALIGRLTA